MLDFAKFLLVGCTIFVTGCASVDLGGQKEKRGPANEPKPGLQAQELKAGECGVFMWNVSGRKEFLYFQKQNAPTGKIFVQGEPWTISALDPTSQLLDSTNINIRYDGLKNESVRFKGSFAEEMEGGWRVGPATLTISSPDSWQEIIPVAGVFACQ